jgi:hypothetical protein
LVVLINELWEPQERVFTLRAVDGYWAQTAAYWAETGAPPGYDGVHSPDERRYFTYLCLCYGADPDARSDLAEDLGLSRRERGHRVRWTGPEGADAPFALMLREEIDYLNSILTLPAPLAIEIALCEQPSAFYDPSLQSVAMCWELAEWMVELRPHM